jgi:hypothetical protein
VRRLYSVGRVNRPRVVAVAKFGFLIVAANLSACIPFLRRGPPHGTIAGKVVTASDSLPISGAIIVIGGEGPASGRAVVSGLSGHFEIINVPPGEYFLIVTTPTLELVGLGTEHAGVRVTQDKVAYVTVRELSGQEMAQRLCANQAKPTGAAVYGQIAILGAKIVPRTTVKIMAGRDANAGAPFEITADSTGRFLACGLLNTSRVMISAVADSFYASPRVVALMDSVFAVYTATLERVQPSPISAGSDSGAMFARTLLSIDSTRKAPIVTGTVRSPDGKPVSGARISIDTASHVVATSDAAGRFVVKGLTAGVHTIVVRRVGSAPQYIGVDVLDEDEWELSIVLSQRPVLEPVRVTAAASMLRVLGFDRRRQINPGAMFLTADDLYVMNAKLITDVFVMMPYLRMNKPSIANPEAVRPDEPNRCHKWMVDGRLAFVPQDHEWSSTWIYYHIPVDSIAAIEIYHPHQWPKGLPYTADGTLRGTDCSVGVIWTKGFIARKEAERLRKK